jgi:hypothetical protein
MNSSYYFIERLMNIKHKDDTIKERFTAGIEKTVNESIINAWFFGRKMPPKYARSGILSRDED